MTDPYDDNKVADDKLAIGQLQDIMQYVGVIPLFYELPNSNQQGQLSVPPPTIFGGDCTSFLDPEDPANQQYCNMPRGTAMLTAYVTEVRHRAGLPESQELLLLVSPYQIYPPKAKIGETFYYRQASFLFDNRITELAGTSDIRWKGIAVTGMHEMGHLIANLSESEDTPSEHNEGPLGLKGSGYPYGCIMTRNLTSDDFNRIYDPNDSSRNPLLFCRTTSNHTDQTTTCHGRVRGLFTGLSYDVDH